MVQLLCIPLSAARSLARCQEAEQSKATGDCACLFRAILGTSTSETEFISRAFVFDLELTFVFFFFSFICFFLSFSLEQRYLPSIESDSHAVSWLRGLWRPCPDKTEYSQVTKQQGVRTLLKQILGCAS